MSFRFKHSWQFNDAFQKPMAYFRMEFDSNRMAKGYYEKLYLNV